MSRRLSRARAALAVFLVAAAGTALVAWMNVRGEDAVDSRPPPAVTPQLVARGAYLARAGNCAACHTDRGGVAYAGGKGIATPFGTVFSSNLTPDPRTGIGRWTAGDFWRAMHHGRSRDGRLLYPAFPYPDYTLVSRADSDALYAYLRTVPAKEQPNRPHELRFPYGTQPALAVWRALFFSPRDFEPAPDRTAEWNRGAYLVQGLGHCQACHAPRNAFGATSTQLDLSGGAIPLQNWYAPSLAAPGEAGVQDWLVEDVVQLLQSGISPRGAAMGPMAEVVAGSTRHLEPADLQAMATFLRDLPRQPAVSRRGPPVGSDVLDVGKRLYGEHCAQCHGAQGQGGGAAYPPLAGHRAVTMGGGDNLVRVILSGGFPATTPGNPRPYGMPPFAHVLGDAEVAAVASFVRSAWGNDAAAVRPLDVQKLR